MTGEQYCVGEKVEMGFPQALKVEVDGFEFIDDLGVNTDPFRYDWSVLESNGNISNIAFSKVDMWLDLVASEDIKIINEWIKYFKKINKPYIYAKGILRKKIFDEIKESKINSFIKSKKDKITKKVFHINNTIVYGLFSSNK